MGDSTPLRPRSAVQRISKKSSEVTHEHPRTKGAVARRPRRRPTQEVAKLARIARLVDAYPQPARRELAAKALDGELRDEALIDVLGKQPVALEDGERFVDAPGDALGQQDVLGSDQRLALWAATRKQSHVTRLRVVLKDFVNYRCADCRDRWDLELPPTDDRNLRVI
jgi:hypothetical protein